MHDLAYLPAARNYFRRARLPQHSFQILKAAEQSERDIIRQLVRSAVNGGRA
jgi:hypothetical protein